MDGFTILQDAPEQLPEGGEHISRVQIAKTGSFKDPRYGRFSITTKDFSKWIENFKALVLDNGREGLPVDVDHSPEKRGTTEAAGWVKELDTLGPDGETSSPTQLWATVEWNTLGQQLIEDRRYAYLSPSYQLNYSDEEGRKHGTALVGVALTNRPFLTMPTISLSAALVFANDTEEPASAPAPPKPNSRAADRQDVMELTAFTEALSLDGEATEEQVLEAIKTLAEKVPGEGQVTLSQADVTRLVEDAQKGQKALDALAAQTFEHAFDKALDEARVSPAQKDSLKALYDKDSETVLSLMKDSPKLVNTESQGGTGHGAEPASTIFDTTQPSTEVDQERLQLAADAEALAAAEKIDFLDAVERLQRERGAA